MTINIQALICDGHRLKWLVAAGLAWLEQNHHKVDELNVFPVPDGDTGKNMLWTLRNAYQEIAGMDEAQVGIVGDAVAHGALMGARGNSGVILSQLWQGFAIAIRGHEVFDAALFVTACESAAAAAYKAVTNPVEGTILTVARDAAEAVRAYHQQQNEQDLNKLLDVMVSAAKTSLAGTPDLLPVLKKAGVVDSGGQGLVYMLEGMLRLMEGKALDLNNGAAAVQDTQTWVEALEPDDEEGYGYDVQFLMHGENMNVEQVLADIDAMGWSTLVVGNDRLIKVHVHVHDPGEPISYAIGQGAWLDDVVVENMQEQYHNYVEDRLARQFSDDDADAQRVAVVAVASGEGLVDLLRQDLGIHRVIIGGQTMNPSTEDFMAAIDSLPNTRIVLLPNNKNVILTAEQAASLARDKEVRVIPTRSVPQGISAMMAYNTFLEPEDLDEVVTAMQDGYTHVITAEVTTAVRDAEIDNLKVTEGQLIGLVNGNLVAVGEDLTTVLLNVLKLSVADSHELITLYYGDTLTEAETVALVESLADEFEDCEFEIVAGGQPLYSLIISVE